MMKKLPSENHLTFLICEEIRPEPGNKLTLMGIFTGLDINIFKPEKEESVTIPSLVFYFSFHDGEGTFKADVKVISPSGSTFREFSDNVTKEKDKGMTMAFKIAPVTFSEPGKYTASISLDGHEFSRKFQVKFSDKPPANLVQS